MPPFRKTKAITTEVVVQDMGGKQFVIDAEQGSPRFGVHESPGIHHSRKSRRASFQSDLCSNLAGACRNRISWASFCPTKLRCASRSFVRAAGARPRRSFRFAEVRFSSCAPDSRPVNGAPSAARIRDGKDSRERCRRAPAPCNGAIKRLRQTEPAYRLIPGRHPPSIRAQHSDSFGGRPCPLSRAMRTRIGKAVLPYRLCAAERLVEG